MTALTIFEMQNQIEERKRLEEQYEMALKAECAKEQQCMVFAIQPNKGDAIPDHVKNIISPQKLGQNLRRFMSQQDQHFQDVKSLSSIPGLAKSFQKYWLEKLKADTQLAQTVGSNDGLMAIHNYIAAEVLRERHKIGDLRDPSVAYALGLSAIARDSRQHAHEAVRKGFNDAAQQMLKEFEANRIRFDDRQIGSLQTIIRICTNDAIERIERGVLSHFDELETRMKALVKDAGRFAIEHKEGQA